MLLAVVELPQLSLLLFLELHVQNNYSGEKPNIQGV